MLTSALPGTGGYIRKELEDFIVDEVPAYLPCGTGDHLMVRVEKRGLTTDAVAQALAQLAGVPSREVGYAGKKDKYAVTRQWFSLPQCTPEQLLDAEGEGWQVLEAGLHGNKLRLGHLKGNRFVVVVRGVGPEAWDRAAAIVARIADQGLPNLFGPQRFGRGLRNVQSAWEWLVQGRRGPRKRSQRQLLVSSLQAALFNMVATHRLAEGLAMVPGDIMKRHDSGGLFVANDVNELKQRLAQGEISPTGPIYGAKMWWPEQEALDVEEKVLASAGLNREVLNQFRKDGRGSRRLLRIFPQGVELSDMELKTAHDEGSPEEGALRVAFFLEAGSFATTMLAEITKTEELKAPTDFPVLLSSTKAVT
jgi:tRNA pseudouridine13 synthase